MLKTHASTVYPQTMRINELWLYFICSVWCGFSCVTSVWIYNKSKGLLKFCLFRCYLKSIDRNNEAVHVHWNKQVFNYNVHVYNIYTKKLRLWIKRMILLQKYPAVANVQTSANATIGCKLKNIYKKTLIWFTYNGCQHYHF